MIWAEVFEMLRVGFFLSLRIISITILGLLISQQAKLNRKKTDNIAVNKVRKILCSIILSLTLAQIAPIVYDLIWLISGHVPLHIVAIYQISNATFAMITTLGLWRLYGIKRKKGEK